MPLDRPHVRRMLTAGIRFHIWRDTRRRVPTFWAPTARTPSINKISRPLGRQHLRAECLRLASDFISGGTRAVVSQFSRAPTARRPPISKISRPLGRQHVRAECLPPASDFIPGGTRAVVSQFSRAPTARTPSISARNCVTPTNTV